MQPALQDGVVFIAREEGFSIRPFCSLPTEATARPHYYELDVKLAIELDGEETGTGGKSRTQAASSLSVLCESWNVIAQPANFVVCADHQPSTCANAAHFTF